MEVEKTTTRPLSLKDWSLDDVEHWMIECNFAQEGKILKDNGITGKAILELDKDSLKEAGIRQLGKRLEIMNEIKLLIAGPKEPNKVTPTPTENKSTLKSKISNNDKKDWKTITRTLYNSKTATIIREASRTWPGNKKVHFKNNELNKLLLDEMVSKLETSCCICQIGFGRDAIRHHIIQWVQQKNRKLTDGYDCEVEHTPAKRARNVDVYPSSSDHESGSTCTSVSEIEDLPDESGQSDSIKDISKKSALCIILVAFNAISLTKLSVCDHFWPLGRHLNVKCRSLSKHDMLIPLAKKLVELKYVDVQVSNEDPVVNYKCLTREQVTAIIAPTELMKRLNPQKDEKDVKGKKDAKKEQSVIDVLKKQLLQTKKKDNEDDDASSASTTILDESEESD